MTIWLVKDSVREALGISPTKTGDIEIRPGTFIRVMKDSFFEGMFDPFNNPIDMVRDQHCDLNYITVDKQTMDDYESKPWTNAPWYGLDV